MPYSTTSLHLAAFLLAKGHPITVTGPTQQREFHFASPDAESDAQSFYTGALIQARLYSGALNDLKKLLHKPASSNSNSEMNHAARRPER